MVNNITLEGDEDKMTMTELPRWNMEIVFPGVNSKEFQDKYASIIRQIDDLQSAFDRNAIDKREPIEYRPSDAQVFEQIIQQFDQLLQDYIEVFAYVRCLVDVDSRNQEAQAKCSEVMNLGVKVRKLNLRLTAWLGSIEVTKLMEASETAASCAYPLMIAQETAKHLMEPKLEDLAADLSTTGNLAWSKLYSDVTSQIMVELEAEGERKNLPMSAIRQLAYDEKRELRKAAYEAELASWKTHELPLAACINCVKGEVNTLSKKRKWDSPLQEALFSARIDQEVLEVMLLAAKESFPDFRRYLQAKAKAIQQKELTWFDLFAPVGNVSKKWDYEEARKFIIEQFQSFSDRMGAFAQRAFDENWIDFPPQDGKVGGAYCMELRKNESRILMNYSYHFPSVSTLAHELGHAYHNLCLSSRTHFQRQTPMTLNETASIFCETIIRNATLKQTEGLERLAILEASLMGACQTVVDITSRFIFEKTVFSERNQRELSPNELCNIMLNAQIETYGDGLDNQTLHPYMWAAKPHYYRASLSFYNFPYMFGLLFSLGLYARYQADPQGFKTGYDELLSMTGLSDAKSLAARYGIEIDTPSFWKSSLDIIRSEIDEFVKEVNANF